jgi:hypothetical protein
MQNDDTVSFLSKLIKSNALIAIFLVIGMLGIFIVKGIGQDPLQYIHSVSDYQNILTRDPNTLKLAVGLDNVFILFYSTMFLALGLVLSRLKQLNLLGRIAIALLMVLTILDLAENMHFLSMIDSEKAGLIVSENEIKIQVWESLIKFHISYIGFYLLSFTLPVSNALEKFLVFLLRWFQWPIGMLIYITPIEITKPLVFVRFTFFIVALLLIRKINFKVQSELRME